MSNPALVRISRDCFGVEELVGEINLEKKTFAYDAAYLCSSQAGALSYSLPLQDTPFTEQEFRPYFEGLLPEGAARRALAEDLGAAEEDYLTLLALCGSDCIGDVIIGDDFNIDNPAYSPLTSSELEVLLSQPSSIAAANISSRLSLAGTQSKIGLFHDDEKSIEEGWSRPLIGAPSTHILKTESISKLALVEYLSLSCARACGLDVAETWLLDLQSPVICSRRYDRSVLESGNQKTVRRLHQEDFTQAFGLLPGSKYSEQVPSTIAAIALFLQEHSPYPLKDIQSLVQLTCFNYAIGNCDNHLKNISLLYTEDWTSASLAPVYDIVSTAYFPQFSEVMGMRIGEASSLKEVTAHDFELVAKEVEVNLAVIQSTCASIIEHAIPSLRQTAAEVALRFADAPLVLDDLEEEVAGRLLVLEEVVSL